jgi:hypothetical protein
MLEILNELWLSSPSEERETEELQRMEATLVVRPTPFVSRKR